MCAKIDKRKKVDANVVKYVGEGVVLGTSAMKAKGRYVLVSNRIPVVGSSDGATGRIPVV